MSTLVPPLPSFAHHTARRSRVTEVFPDGRLVVDGEFVMPRNLNDGCWCGETLFAPCRHQVVAGEMAPPVGVISMPALPMRGVITNRIGSEVATHPGVATKHWLRLLDHSTDVAWRVAGFAKARRDHEVRAVLRGSGDARVAQRMLLMGPIAEWPQWREMLMHATGSVEGMAKVRLLAAKRVEMGHLRWRDLNRAWATDPASKDGVVAFMADLGFRPASSGGVSGKLRVVPRMPAFAQQR